MTDPPAWIKRSRLGLLCNPASVDSRLRHARELINSRFPGQLAALYSPQHGFYAEKQDNMIESGNLIDPVLKIPVFSLYGQSRIPSQAMLDPVDVLMIDLQDVGTRVYTFIYTMSYCMEAAARFDKKILVLDRPNPINGTAVEGNCLSPEYASFVGRFPIPMRHGLTVAELALLFKRQFKIECDLQVVPMQGWNRSMLFNDTGLPWVAPSPNLPTPASALVYPGQVLWEGTNVSEGRGTTQPFELCGAPYFDLQRISGCPCIGCISGAVLRPTAFEPTANKWQNQLCHGFQIHVTDPERFRPYMTTLKLLQAVISQHGQAFEWKQPPYEYEYEKLPIDLIIGDKNIRKRVEALDNLADIEETWQTELNEFREISQAVRLYA